MGKCAICKIDTAFKTDDGVNMVIGEMAHIEGENPGSARYNANMTGDERNSYDNLILLCPNHHTEIDKNPVQYPVDKLKQIKSDHEKWLEYLINSQMSKITFAELEVLLKYLDNTPIRFDKENYLPLVPPAEKIQKNDLSVSTANLIKSGMMQVKLVRDYLNQHPDMQFAERLTEKFIEKYKLLRNKGLSGDDLFYELWDFAAMNPTKKKYIITGLTVLVYFFEECKVFEP